MATEAAPTLEESIARLKEAGSYDPADFTGTDLSTTDSIKRLTKWLGKKKPAVIILDSCSISDKGSVLLASHFEANETCAALYMSKNNIGDKGATAFAALIANAPNTGSLPIEYFNFLANPKITTAGMEELIASYLDSETCHTLCGIWSAQMPSSVDISIGISFTEDPSSAGHIVNTEHEIQGDILLLSAELARGASELRVLNIHGNPETGVTCLPIFRALEFNETLISLTITNFCYSSRVWNNRVGSVGDSSSAEGDGEGDEATEVLDTITQAMISNTCLLTLSLRLRPIKGPSAVIGTLSPKQKERQKEHEHDRQAHNSQLVKMIGNNSSLTTLQLDGFHFLGYCDNQASVSGGGGGEIAGAGASADADLSLCNSLVSTVRTHSSLLHLALLGEDVYGSSTATSGTYIASRNEALSLLKKAISRSKCLRVFRLSNHTDITAGISGSEKVSSVLAAQRKHRTTVLDTFTKDLLKELDTPARPPAAGAGDDVDRPKCLVFRCDANEYFLAGSSAGAKYTEKEQLQFYDWEVGDITDFSHITEKKSKRKKEGEDAAPGLKTTILPAKVIAVERAVSPDDFNSSSSPKNKRKFSSRYSLQHMDGKLTGSLHGGIECNLLDPHYAHNIPRAVHVLSGLSVADMALANTNYSLVGDVSVTALVAAAGAGETEEGAVDGKEETRKKKKKKKGEGEEGQESPEKEGKKKKKKGEGEEGQESPEKEGKQKKKKHKHHEKDPAPAPTPGSVSDAPAEEAAAAAEHTSNKKHKKDKEAAQEEEVVESSAEKKEKKKKKKKNKGDEPAAALGEDAGLVTSESASEDERSDKKKKKSKSKRSHKDEEHNIEPSTVTEHTLKGISEEKTVDEVDLVAADLLASSLTADASEVESKADKKARREQEKLDKAAEHAKSKEKKKAKKAKLSHGDRESEGEEETKGIAANIKVPVPTTSPPASDAESTHDKKRKKKSHKSPKSDSGSNVDSKSSAAVALVPRRPPNAGIYGPYHHPVYAPDTLVAVRFPGDPVYYIAVTANDTDTEPAPEGFHKVTMLDHAADEQGSSTNIVDYVQECLVRKVDMNDVRNDEIHIPDATPSAGEKGYYQVGDMVGISVYCPALGIDNAESMKESGFHYLPGVISKCNARDGTYTVTESESNEKVRGVAGRYLVFSEFNAGDECVANVGRTFIPPEFVHSLSADEALMALAPQLAMCTIKKRNKSGNGGYVVAAELSAEENAAPERMKIIARQVFPIGREQDCAEMWADYGSYVVEMQSDKPEKPAAAFVSEPSSSTVESKKGMKTKKQRKKREEKSSKRISGSGDSSDGYDGDYAQSDRESSEPVFPESSSRLAAAAPTARPDVPVMSETQRTQHMRQLFSAFRSNSAVVVNYHGTGQLLRAAIMRDKLRGLYDVKYDDGEVEENVPLEMIQIVPSSTGGNSVDASAAASGNAHTMKSQAHASQNQSSYAVEQEFFSPINPSHRPASGPASGSASGPASGPASGASSSSGPRAAPPSGIRPSHTQSNPRARSAGSSSAGASNDRLGSAPEYTGNMETDGEFMSTRGAHLHEFWDNRDRERDQERAPVSFTGGGEILMNSLLNDMSALQLVLDQEAVTLRRAMNIVDSRRVYTDHLSTVSGLSAPEVIRASTSGSISPRKAFGNDGKEQVLYSTFQDSAGLSSHVGTLPDLRSARSSSVGSFTPQASKHVGAANVHNSLFLSNTAPHPTAQSHAHLYQSGVASQSQPLKPESDVFVSQSLADIFNRTNANGTTTTPLAYGGAASVGGIISSSAATGNVTRMTYAEVAAVRVLAESKGWNTVKTFASTVATATREGGLDELLQVLAACGYESGDSLGGLFLTLSQSCCTADPAGHLQQHLSGGSSSSGTAAPRSGHCQKLLLKFLELAQQGQAVRDVRAKYQF